MSGNGRPGVATVLHWLRGGERFQNLAAVTGTAVRSLGNHGLPLIVQLVPGSRGKVVSPEVRVRVAA